MNNAIFLKTMTIVRKCRVIKLATTITRKIYLVSERNYRTKKNLIKINYPYRNEKRKYL